MRGVDQTNTLASRRTGFLTCWIPPGLTTIVGSCDDVKWRPELTNPYCHPEKRNLTMPKDWALDCLAQMMGIAHALAVIESQ